MNKESFDPDDPTSVAAAGGPPRETMDEFADTASSTTTGANAGAAGAGSDDEGEDDMPDYRLLAAFARFVLFLDVLTPSLAGRY